jgi:hypothetical protein
LCSLVYRYLIRNDEKFVDLITVPVWYSLGRSDHFVFNKSSVNRLITTKLLSSHICFYDRVDKLNDFIYFNVDGPHQNRGIFWIFFYFNFIRHCFICRPSGSTASEDAGNLIKIPLLSGYPAEGGISPQSASRSLRTADSPGGSRACSCLASS